MTTAVIHLLAAEGERRGVDLPLEPWAIGLGTFILFCVLLAVTLSFGKDR